MRFLRKNTAVRITVGPFFDKTDGVTPEAALTVTNCKLTATVDADDGTGVTLVLDAAATASGGVNDMVHVTNDDAGYYDLELTAANTNYNGRFHLAITDAANHCPVFHEFTILPTQVYDSLIAGSDTLQVDVSQFGNTAGGFVNGRPEVDSGLLVRTTIATLTDQDTFTLTAGSADNDAYNDCVAVITDQATVAQKAVVYISDYVGSTKTVELAETPQFTIATGDHVAVYMDKSQRAAQLLVGAAGLQTLLTSIQQGVVNTNNDKTGYALSAVASAALTEGYAADGVAPTLAQILYEIRALLAEKNISGVTVTTKKLDGSATAATYTLNDATNPTSITRAS